MGIACSWSCCVDGFHRSSRPSRSSGRRPLCAGTGPASEDIGGGNPAPLEADRKSTRTPPGPPKPAAALESYIANGAGTVQGAEDHEKQVQIEFWQRAARE